MPNLICLVVRDEKADCYAHPFFVPAIGIGLRMFEDWSKDKTTAVGLHPEDYSIFRVGSYDQVSGVFEPEAVPVFLARPTNVAVPDVEVGPVPGGVQSLIAREHFKAVHTKGGGDGGA